MRSNVYMLGELTIMLRKIIFYVCLGLLSLNPLRNMAQAQERVTCCGLGQRIGNIHLRQVSLSKVITRIAIDAKLNIGRELNSGSEKERADIDFEEGTVEDLVGTIIAKYPAYKWTASDGFIYISPTVKQPNIADIVISEYRTKDRHSFDLIASILSLPEVEKEMQLLGVEPINIAVEGISGYTMESGFSLEAKNVTIRHILNEIARQSFDHYWVVRRGGERGELLMIYL